MRRGFLLQAKGGRKAASASAGTAAAGETDSGPAGTLGAGSTKASEKNLQALAGPSSQGQLGVPKPPSAKVKIPTGDVTADDFGPEVPKLPDNLAHLNIVTLPTPAQNKGAHDVSSVCILFMGMKDKIFALPGFPQPPVNPSRFPPWYMIESVPGAGLGMLAFRDIAPGELIIAERPALIMPAMMPYHTPQGPGMVDVYVKTAIDAMWETHRKEFYELHNCKPVTPSYSHLRGITDTNGIALGVFPGWSGGSMAGICTQISRINHSCAPNAHARWNMLSFQEEVRALKPIKEGEQIFISYVGGMLDPRAQRRKILRKKYGFTCECTACARTPEEAKRSDARRKLLAAFIKQHPPGDERELRAWVADASMPEDAVIARSLRVLEMMDEEGRLEVRAWAAHYQRLVKAYCALGDAEKARAWARKAAALTTAYTGQDGGWGKVADAPQNTDWWGLRATGREPTE